ncbi:MAG: hypothetical protein ABI416_17510 [Ginsengibacter sp.]
MLVWWILSLIILITCFIFAYRMIVSTYDFLPADKRYFLGFYKNSDLLAPTPPQKDTVRALNKKIQSVEDSNTFYEIQFSKLQERLKALEELNSLSPSPLRIANLEKGEDEEDWKEMYYEENTVKERLENDLDYTRQMLEETENKLKESSDKNTRWIELQSEHESRANDNRSLQEHIGLLKRQLVASTEREKELEQLLLSEITLREKYSILQREFTALQSETDDLRRRVVEINKAEYNKKGSDRQVLVVHLDELESKLAFVKKKK